jgi:hypothetical protein
MGASILGIPELALEPAESEKLSKAIQNVAQYYPVGLSPKTMAWVNLAMVAGGLYGTRFMAYSIRTKGEKRKKLTVVPAHTEQSYQKPNGVPQPLTPSQMFGQQGVSDE